VLLVKNLVAPFLILLPTGYYFLFQETQFASRQEEDALEPVCLRVRSPKWNKGHRRGKQTLTAKTHELHAQENRRTEMLLGM